MTRNLRMLGLALIAVFALSAMAAAAAQATPLFTAAKYNASIHATTEQKIGAESEYFESIGRKFECEIVHYTGTATSDSSTLSITPDYTDSTQGGNCKAAQTLSVTVTENGCTFLFHAQEFMDAAKDYTVFVDVVCGANPIVVNVLGGACIITIGSQTAGGTLTAVNSSGHVELSGTVSVKSTLHSENGLICGIPKGTKKELTTSYAIHKAITFTGEEDQSPFAADPISISGK